MKFIYIAFLQLLTLLLPLTTTGQEVKFEHKDIQFSALEGFRANDAKLLRLGGYERLAVVGGVSRGEKTWGALYVINLRDWSVIDSFLVADVSIKGFAETQNGSLYLGGSRTVGRNKQKGWMQRLDLNTRRADSIGIPPEIVAITDMAWLDRGGLAFGQFPKGGNLAVFKLGGGKTLTYPYLTIGNGLIKNLAAVAPFQSHYDEAWLVGQTSKKANRSTWFLKIDERGNMDDDPLVLLGSDDTYEGAVAATIDTGDHLAVAGGTQIESGDNSPWLLKPSQRYFKNNENAVNYSLPTIGDDSIAALTATSCHGFLAMIQGNSGSQTGMAFHKITDNAINPMPYFTIASSRRFEPVGFIRHEISQNTYYLVGTSTDWKGKDQRLRIIEITESCAKGKEMVEREITPPSFGKGGIAATETAPVGGPELQLQNIALYSTQNEQSTVLAAHGEVSVLFSLKNTGEDMSAPGEIRVMDQTLVKGLSIRPQCLQIPFPALKKGQQSRTISILVNAAGKIEGGTSSFEVAVLMAGKPLFQFSSPVIETTVQDKTTTLTWKTIANATREAQTTGQLVLRTNRSELGGSNIDIGEDQRIRQNKARPVLISHTEEAGMHVYTFKVDIPLDTGLNKLYARLTDDPTITTEERWFIRREPPQPNLYIISIGVPGRGLEYTDEDAVDFGEKVAAMAGGPFFKEVKLKLIKHTAPLTTRDEIQSAINTLATRSAEIRPEDYIMVLISSHGNTKRIGIDERFFILPSNFQSAGAPLEGKPGEVDEDDKAYYYHDMLEILKSIPCKRFVFIDACHSGLGKGVYDQRLIEAANKIAPGVVCFLSSSAQQLSFEYENGKNGVFTQAVLEAMEGKPVERFNGTGFIDPNPDKNKVITIGELRAFLAERVPDILKDTKYATQQQTPVCLKQTDVQTSMKELPDDLPIFTIRQE